MSDSSPCPEFSNTVEKFLEEDFQESVIKMFKVRKHTMKSPNFHEFLHKLLKQHIKHVELVKEGKATNDSQTISFTKLFPNSQVLQLFLREEPHNVCADLIGQITEIENIEIEGEDIIYNQIDFPKAKDLAKVFQIYFDKLDFCLLDMKDAISQKSKIYFKPLVAKWLKINHVYQTDFQGKAREELNLEQLGVNIFYKGDGSGMFKVKIEFASSSDNSENDPKKVINFLKTFIEQFKYDNSIENLDVDNKKISKNLVQKLNDILIPGAPFEVHIGKVAGVEKFEIYGLKDYVTEVKTSLQNILKKEATVETEAHRIKNNCELDPSQMLVKQSTMHRGMDEPLDEDEDEFENESAGSIDLMRRTQSVDEDYEEAKFDETEIGVNGRYVNNDE